MEKANGSRQLYQEAEDISGLSREDLLIKYLPLIKRIAGRMSMALPATLEENDLIGCGIVGLLEAWDRYDASRGVDFPAYASRRIKGAMVDELRKLAWGPRSFFARFRQTQQAEESLEQQLGREPSTEEIAATLSWTPQQVEEVWKQHHLYAVTSLEKVLFGNMEEDGMRLEEVVASGVDPGDAVTEEEQKKELAMALEALSEREQVLLSLYYYEKLTQKEIAEVLEISTVRVSQLHSRALQKLYKHLQKGNDHAL